MVGIASHRRGLAMQKDKRLAYQSLQLRERFIRQKLAREAGNPYAPMQAMGAMNQADASRRSIEDIRLEMLVRMEREEALADQFKSDGLVRTTHGLQGDFIQTPDPQLDLLRNSNAEFLLREPSPEAREPQTQAELGAAHLTMRRQALSETVNRRGDASGKVDPVYFHLLPEDVRHIVLEARRNRSLSENDAEAIRQWLYDVCGGGTEEIGDPIPALQAIQNLLPLFMQALVFDEDTRDMIDTAAHLCGYFGDDYDDLQTSTEINDEIADENPVETQDNKEKAKSAEPNAIPQESSELENEVKKVSENENTLIATTSNETTQKASEDQLSSSSAHDNKDEGQASQENETLFTYLIEFMEQQRAIELEAKSQKQKDVEKLVANLKKQDIPGFAEFNDIAIAERRGFEPIAWLRWLFVSALENNLDTKPLQANLQKILPLPIISRVFANHMFREDVKRLLNSSEYSHGIPDWAPWADVKRQQEQQLGAVVSRIKTLITSMTEHDLPFDMPKAIAFIRTLIVSALENNLATEPLFPRLRFILQHNADQFIEKIFLNANFCQDCRQALKNYKLPMPFWADYVMDNATASAQAHFAPLPGSSQLGKRKHHSVEGGQPTNSPGTQNKIQQLAFSYW